MKRKISYFQYGILKNELKYLEDVGGLKPNQSDELLSYYEVSEMNHKANSNHRSEKKFSLNFISIISLIGAILIGLSILSFVASNWSAISDFGKFALLLSSLVASYIFAWLMEEKSPLTSKALYYIGVFAFGTEIFYIGQLFHIGGDIGTAFLAWSIGILPLTFYKNDKIIYAIAYGLFYLSIELKFMLIDGGNPSLWMIVILPLLFIAVHYVTLFKKYLLIANFVLLYQFIEMTLMIDSGDLWVLALPVIIGLFALNHYVYPQEKYLLIANFVLLYQFVEFNLWLKAVDSGLYVFFIIPALIGLFFIGHKWMNKSVILFTANVIVSLQTIALILAHLGVESEFVYLALFFIIGLIFTHFHLPDYEIVMKWIGYAVQFIAGLGLTVPFIYGEETVVLYFLFGFMYMIYGFFLVYKNQLFGVLLVSVLIFRFYVDLSLVFLNKSIAFFIGGILLLGLAYWFEKTRRGEKKREKNAK